MRWMLLVAVAVLPLCGQRKEVRLSVWTVDGVRLYFATHVVPPGGPQINSGMVVVGRDNAVHRLIADQTGVIRFAYDIQAQRAGAEFKLLVRPIALDYEQRIRSEDWYPKPGDLTAEGRLPTFAAAREIGGLKEGDSVSVDLMSRPDSGQKVVDVIYVSSEPPPGYPARPRSKIPPDEFDLDSIKVTVSGRAGGPHTWQHPARLTGAAALLYLPGFGAFFLALEPPGAPGFEPAGTVERNRLTFVWKNEFFEVLSGGNILKKSEFGRVWIRHDPGYVPKGSGRSWNAADQLGLTTSDDIEYLIPK